MVYQDVMGKAWNKDMCLKYGWVGFDKGKAHMIVFGKRIFDVLISFTKANSHISPKMYSTNIKEFSRT